MARKSRSALLRRWEQQETRRQIEPAAFADAAALSVLLADPQVPSQERSRMRRQLRQYAAVTA